ncbi:exodeoxyribonuclease V subunit alpha [Bacterioplanes sanyensis]|uniref:exodeoxyribonuclease V subunit alpha n=1 Tax=Bacterioplanes sanyensis TaxID=1249553 RepID=UPI0018EE9511|nr:exodeoxyribonuclease V subunit alpha [Bacterioplanes sanyensis]
MSDSQLSFSFDQSEPLSESDVAELLSAWQQAQWLRPLDCSFAQLIVELEKEQGRGVEPLVLLLAALTSYQVGRGHVCIDLAALVNDSRQALALSPDEERSWQTLETQTLPQHALAHLSLNDCLEALQRSVAVSDGSEVTPLVLQGQRLYLRRLWRYEQTIAANIAARLSARAELLSADSEQAVTLSQALAQLFEFHSATDYQKLACALAARSRFAVITGGPGTGKTTTVVKLLAALQALAAVHRGQPYRIRLAAPTGKAAARLNESIAAAVGKLPLSLLPGPPARNDIPTQVTTVHRLLGSRPNSRHFRHHSGHPLPLDILVVDEASMVDVDLMAALLDALPDTAQLILLGDKDQLASVDAGAVLGELCARATEGHYTHETASWLQQVCQQPVPASLRDDSGRALDQVVAMLRVSYRFQQDSGIRELAQAVNERALTEPLLTACRNSDFADVCWLHTENSDAALQQLALHAVDGSAARFANVGRGRVLHDQPLPPPCGYRHYLQQIKDCSLTEKCAEPLWQQWAAGVLEAFSEFQILCAVRQGPWGVEGVNQLVAEQLRQSNLIERSDGWYPGRPVLVTANDYNLGLMNGDIGITLRVPLGRTPDGGIEWVLRVAFPAAQDRSAKETAAKETAAKETAVNEDVAQRSAGQSQRVRWVSPSRLQQLETVFAMTVHKSQGSEFNHTCLVLPDRMSPVLTKELLYTGITRAKNWFSFLTPNEALLPDIAQQAVTRVSGLREGLEQQQVVDDKSNCWKKRWLKEAIDATSNELKPRPGSQGEGA